MRYKTCPRCTRDLAANSFYPNKSRTDLLSNWCRTCTTQERRDYYQRNREREIKTSALRTRERRLAYYQKLNSLKSKHGCSCCPERDPSCLDFHHLNRNAKQHTIGVLVHDLKPWWLVVQELVKCIILCGNCHRKHHAGKLSLTDVQPIQLTDEEMSFKLPEEEVLDYVV